MSVPSIAFVLFALVAAAAYHLRRSEGWRALTLLAANFAFLLSLAARPVELLPFALFLALGYGAISLLHARRVSGLAALAIGAVLVAFVWLKRYSFIPAELWLHVPYFTIGLSYVFFRVMHLVIDARTGDLAKPVPLLAYVNYCTNFLCLVAGPIQRYEDYSRQQAAPARPLDLALMIGVAERVILGLFKVTVVSMLLLEQQQYAVTLLGEEASSRLLVALQVVLIYPLYLYANFSGYCDVAIALGRLFALDLPENFDHPFRAGNFIEFWSRWHITLSSWLKTYVYSPLMMRLMSPSSSLAASTAFSAFAFFVTFFLVGAWHGQTSEFLFFGLLQGGGVAVTKLNQTIMTQLLGRKAYVALGKNRLYAAFCRGLTFVWFGFTLLWFWADWQTIGKLGSFLGWSGAIAAGAIAAILAAIILEALLTAGRVIEAWPVGGRHARVAFASAQIAAIWVIAFILAAPPPDIVYKNF